MKRKLIFMIMTIWGTTFLLGNVQPKAQEKKVIYTKHLIDANDYHASSYWISSQQDAYREESLTGDIQGDYWISSPADIISNAFIYADIYPGTSEAVVIKKITYSTYGDKIDLKDPIGPNMDERERYMKNYTYDPENMEVIGFMRLYNNKPAGEIVLNAPFSVVTYGDEGKEVTFNIENNNIPFRYIGIRLKKEVIQEGMPNGLMKMDNLKFYKEGEKPVIHVENKVVNIYDKFDKMAGVKATDKEDGDISYVKVTGDVNTNIAGNYKLTYEVRDQDENEVSKTIEVVVKGIDKKELQAEIEKAKNIDKTKYTNESVYLLETQLKNAEDIFKREEAKQEEVNNAKKLLADTISKLDIKPVVKEEEQVVKVSNEKPIINVENKSIKAYENFDKMAGVKATDKEDGDITSKVKVIGDVNTKVAGKYNLIYEVTDKDGNKVSKAIEVIVHKLPITLERAIGRDRYDTATKLSQIEFNKSDTVVIVNGSAIVDGLTATPLATYLKAPILLAGKNTVPDETVNEIRRLGATKAIIAGGAGVVSENVVNKLKSLGINTVERVAGKDRYETSLEIAKYIDRNFYDISNVIVSSGIGEADALSIASVAGRDKMPIILVEKDMIPSEVYNWMKNEDLQNAYIIGGTGVVNNTVLNLVNGITKNNISENRLGGIDRYETNAKVISKFYSNSLDKVYVAKALVLIDALTAGPVAAVGNAPVILANGNLTEVQRNTLASKKANKLIQAGGGVSEEAVNSLKSILN